MRMRMRMQLLCLALLIQLAAAGLPTPFKETFETTLTTRGWTTLGGGSGAPCAPVSSGNAGYFFTTFNIRFLISPAIDTRNASTLQFMFNINGAAPCNTYKSTDNVVLSYSTDGTNFTPMTTLSTSGFQSFAIPVSNANVYFRFYQTVATSPYNYSPWAVDDFYVGFLRSGSNPTVAADNFASGAVDETLATFYPGGQVMSSYCNMSNALVFTATDSVSRQYTTIALNANVEDRYLTYAYYESFEGGLNTTIWNTALNSITVTSSTYATFVTGTVGAFNNAAKRLLISKSLNLVNVVSISAMYSNGIVSAVSTFGGPLMLDFSTDGTTWTNLLSVPATTGTQLIRTYLPTAARKSAVFIRFQQLNYTTTSDVSTVDNIRFEVNSTAVAARHVLQFDLYMGDALCNPWSSSTFPTSNNIIVEYATDNGVTWQSIQAEPTVSSLFTISSSSNYYDFTPGAMLTIGDYTRWRHVTYFLRKPIFPQASVQFRIRQVVSTTYTYTSSNTWAIANVYFGSGCATGCNNVGNCQVATVNCICDNGYTFMSSTCQPINNGINLPDSFSDGFVSDATVSSNWQSIIGGSVETKGVQADACQAVATPAMTFAALTITVQQYRRITTVPIRTTDLGYLSFLLFNGQCSRQGYFCFSSPYTPIANELVVSYSTNGGITWILMSDLSGASGGLYGSGKSARIGLTADMRTPMTMFRVEQLALGTITASACYSILSWAMDTWFLGGSATQANLPYFIDDMSNATLTNIQWTTLAGAVNINTTCEPRPALHVSDGGFRYALTTPIFVVTDLVNSVTGGLSDTFNDPWVSANWITQTGITRASSTTCTSVSLNSNFIVTVASAQVQAFGTKALDTRYCQTLKFTYYFLRSNCQAAQGGSSFSVQYSRDFSSWTTMKTLNSATTKTTLALALPANAIAQSVYFRFYSTSRSLLFLDDFIMNPSTMDVVAAATGAGSFIEFKLRMNTCPGAVAPYVSPTYDVVLYGSIDYGNTFTIVQSVCDPSPSSCTQFSLPSQYSSATFQSFMRVMVPVSDVVTSNFSVFQFNQPFLTDPTVGEWDLTDVYIGKDCPRYCNGHGSCMTRACVCDTGYTLANGTCWPVPDFLSGFARDNFEWASITTPDPTIWSSSAGVIGGTVGCGGLSDGYKALFSGSGQRFLQTVDLKASNSEFLQFYYAVGGNGLCSTVPAASGSGAVTLSYSTDSGVRWTYFQVVQIVSGLVTVSLQNVPLTDSSRIMFYQSTYTSANAQYWSLDNFYFGGCAGCNPVVMSEDFSNINKNQFIFYPGGTSAATFCSRINVMSFASVNTERSISLAQMNINSASYDDTYASFDSGSLELLWDTSSTTVSAFGSGCGTEGGSRFAMYFNSSASPRVLQTLPSVYPIDAILFWVRAGAAVSGACEAPGVNNFLLFEYLPSGAGTWKTVMQFNYNDAGITSGVYVNLNSLPADATQFNTTYRFRQPTFTANQDVWMVDSLLFLHNNATLSSASVMQFMLNLGCQSTFDSNNDVQLQFSLDYGVSWANVDGMCAGVAAIGSPLCTTGFPLPMSFSGTGFSSYTRITHPMMADALDYGSVRLRFSQLGTWSSVNDKVWALDDLYVGTDCPGYCSGHGTCVASVGCQCDSGYTQSVVGSCTPTTSLISTLSIHFEGASIDPTSVADLSGCTISSAFGTCGIVSENQYLYCNGNGSSRYFSTVDMNTQSATYIQFNLVIGGPCSGPSSTNSQLYLLYSTDGGTLWNYMTTFAPSAFATAKMSTILLPVAAQTSATRFRFYQSKSSTEPMRWAIDDIYIGGSSGYLPPIYDDFAPMTASNFVKTPYVSDSQSYCSVSGVALANGVTQSSPVIVRAIMPIGVSVDVINDNLYYSSVVSSTSINAQLFSTALPVNTNCGSFSGYAFTATGATRTLTTQALNLVTASTLSFWLKFGLAGDPFVSTCSAVVAGEDVYVYYSLNGGTTFTSFSRIFTTDSGASSAFGATFTISIPAAARQPSVILRWAQPTNRGGTNGLWAVDEFMITPAQSSNALYLEAIVQIGCGTSKTYALNVEYSVDNGVTWALTVPTCTLCGHFSDVSTYTSSTFTSLTSSQSSYLRMTVPLPTASISPSTRFRIIQPSSPFTSADWAVDSLFVGASCLNMCTGHGTCLPTGCVCDSGYSTDDCSVPAFNSNFFRSSFDFTATPLLSWSKIEGGALGTTTCAGTLTISGGNLLSMTSAGNRAATTFDMDTTSSTILQFLSSDRSGTCAYALVDQAVAVAYSTNGGITWTVLYQLLPTVTSHVVAIPPAARSPATRFRFYQTANMTVNAGVWGIDDVYVGGQLSAATQLFESFDPITESNWVFRGLVDSSACPLANELNNLHFGSYSGLFSMVTADLDLSSLSLGSAGKSPFYDGFEGGTTLKPSLWQAGSVGTSILTTCSPQNGTNSLVFSLGSATRTATTVPQDLTGAVYITFYAVGCSSNDPTGYPLVLQFSVNGGASYTPLLSVTNKAAAVYTVNVTAAMMTTSTILQFSQAGTLPVNTKHWGVDNFQIFYTRPTSGPFVQFNLVRICGTATTPTAAIGVYYSLDYGVTWNPLSTPCTPGSSSCMTYIEDPVAYYQKETVYASTRVTLPIVNTAVFAVPVRFRISTSSKTGSADFAVDNLYIGSDATCPNMCSNKGTCRGSQCVCDRGYYGLDCAQDPPLPTTVSITALNSVNSAYWTRVSNVVVASNICGSGTTTLEFLGSGVRFIESIDYDLRNTTHIKFSLGFCGTIAAADALYLEYSVDGGITWNYQMVYVSALSYSLYIIQLPTQARQNGVRFRFRQPSQTSASSGLWALGAFYLTTGTAPVVSGCGNLICETSESCATCPVDCPCPVSICASSPCSNGGSCLDQLSLFTCLCPYGFTGVLCQSQINYCASNPCISGTCVASLGMFMCNCPIGRTGILCESDIDYCASSPCMHGSTCARWTNGTTGFNCTCASGWSGVVCSIASQPCLSSPCKNFGVCANVVNSDIAACNCTGTGFTGSVCEVNIDDCLSSPCAFGKCIDGVNSYFCNCSNTGYQGVSCSVDIDECLSSPCQNGAVCNNLVNRFNCTCSSSRFSGTLCEIDSGICAGTTVNSQAGVDAMLNCQNIPAVLTITSGADIVDLSPLKTLVTAGGLVLSGLTALRNLTGLTALTTIGSSGLTITGCSLLTNLAGLSGLRNVSGSVVISNNSALTVLSGLDSVSTINGSLTIDANAHLINASNVAPRGLGKDLRVSSNAMLIVLPNLRFLTKLTGNLVIVDNAALTNLTGLATIKQFAANVTINRNAALGHLDGLVGLTNINGSFWLENNTAIYSISGLANVTAIRGAVAVNTNGNLLQSCPSLVTTLLAITASCKTGKTTLLSENAVLTTVTCGVNNVTAHVDECLYGGTCRELMAGSFSCNCPAAFSGRICAYIEDACYSSPCQHGGVCVDGVETYTCYCSSQYGGVNCETCASGRYGPTCTSQCSTACTNTSCFTGITGNGSCIACGPTSYGPTCATCNCLNGAACSSGVSGTGACQCSPGFTGILCEARMSMCASSPCQHGGQCVEGAPGAFTCTCSSTGYSGTLCSVDIDECALPSTNACSTVTGNVCTNIDGSYTCSCQLGYFGYLTYASAATCQACNCNVNGSYSSVCDGSSGQCNCTSLYTGLQCSSFVADLACPVFDFPAHSFGTSAGCQSRRTGDTCIFNCTSGYTLSGDSEATCGSDGKWSLVISSCLDTCPNLPAPPNSSPSCATTMNVGLTCRQTCNPGYTTTSGTSLRTCSSGGVWAGTNLVCTDINECASNPCLNGATCVNGLLSFSCTCATGYFGVLCDQSACDSSPCLNGGTCRPATGNSFVCLCSGTGYNGTTCAVDVNECLGSNLCDPLVNSCSNNIGSYSCGCIANYYGTRVAAGPALCNPCGCDLNGATSTSCSSSGQCTCLTGYAGRTCSTIVSLQVCQPFVPVANAATTSDACVSGQVDDACTFTCLPGYLLFGDTVAYCQSSGQWTYTSTVCLDQCPAIAAPNNGSVACASTTTIGQTCQQLCNAGFALSGSSTRTCQTGGYWSGTAVSCSLVNQCLSNPCLNAGSCVNGVNSFTCVCSGAYYGTLCQHTYCASNPCQNGGTCTSSDSSGIFCVCTGTGYEGPYCNTDVNECLSSTTNACLALANQCINTIGGYQCACAAGYYGLSATGQAATGCTNCNCSTQGSSNITCDLYGQCSCLAGYAGSKCSIVVSSQICPVYTAPLNGYTASDGCTLRNNGAVCELACASGYVLTGDASATCTVSGWSFASTSCIAQCPLVPAPVDGSVTCQATTQIGITCLQKCNLGTTLSGTAQRTCQSDGTWSGTKVQCTQINECLSSPCQPNAVCIDEVNSFTCACGLGYFGTLCEFSECSSNPCQFGGTCSLLDYADAFVCNCTGTGYDGTVCSDDVDECATGVSLCEGHAGNQCVNLLGSYSCACMNEYYGLTVRSNFAQCKPCSCDPAGSADTICDITGQCSCAPGYTGLNCSALVSTQLCQPFPLPAHSYSNDTGCNEGKLNSECLFGCLNGYVAQGTYFSSICQINGLWTFVDGRCAPQCPVVNAPVNGSVTCGATTTIGITCRQLCDRGFAINGTAVRTCDSTGAWTGTPVECVQINECLSSPCQNGGSCHDGILSFTCECASLYYGTFCEESLCDSNPCQNGGVCGDGGNNTYYCECFGSGFTGAACEIDVDECASSSLNLCLPGINKCTNFYGGYSCVCEASYYGPYIDNGPATGCQACNCNDTGATSSQCNSVGYCFCFPGYAGQTCSTEVPPQLCPVYNLPANALTVSDGCSTRQPNDTCTFACQSGFVLVDASNTPTGLVNETSECLASGDWTDAPLLCIAQCPAVPAPQFGNGVSCSATTTVGISCRQSCQNGYLLHGSTTRTCTASGTWTGVPVSCTFIDACLSSPCQNGATCVSGINKFTCQCPSPFVGITCQTSLCDSNPCQHGGVCRDAGNSSIICACDGTGYSGSFCESDINECSAGIDACNPTSNLCVNSLGSYSCQCRDSFYGSGSVMGAAATCQSCNCNPTGSATAACDVTNGQCTCFAGYSDQTCSTIATCGAFLFQADAYGLNAACNGTTMNSLCQIRCSGGLTLQGDTVSVCLSTGQWSLVSYTCVLQCPAVPAPAFGVGTCASTSVVGVTCRQSCSNGYLQNGTSVRTCQSSGSWSGTPVSCTFINECLSAPCINGGSCVALAGGFQCNCPSLYFGSQCESYVCAVNPCENDGICINYGDNTPACDCTGTGFEGGVCEVDINECLDTITPVCLPVENTCTNAFGGYQCNCAPEYYGTAGYNDVATCIACNCNATGAASLQCNSQGRCTCQDGFAGQTCDVVVPPQLCAFYPLGNNSLTVSDGCSTRQPNDTCDVICEAGFVFANLAGNTVTSTCLISGEWSFVDTTCIAQCPLVAAPGNGSVDCDATTVVGNTCIQKCDNGYVSHGSSIRVCAANGLWTGTPVTCQFIDRCATNQPCQNGAQCIPSLLNYTCICSSAFYTGVNCEVSACKADTCLNNGVCYPDLVALTPVCNCSGTGYDGSSCSVDIDECATGTNLCNPITNACINSLGSYSCACRPGFYAANDSSLPVIAGGAVNCLPCNCDPTGALGSSCNLGGCTCAQGYTGPTCSARILEYCAPYQLPVNTKANGSACSTGYIGDECDFTCSTGFVSTSQSAFRSFCQSTKAWTGVSGSCIPECPLLVAPANGSGLCSATATIGATCVQQCDSGYSPIAPSSRTCQTNGTWSGRSLVCTFIDTCASSPCFAAGGSCVAGLLSFTCVCNPGYTGEFCQRLTSFLDCSSSPCQHGGVCVDTALSHTCLCNGTGYSGASCEVNINECLSSPCGAGICIDGVNKFTCNCANTGYTGTFCQSDIDECASSPCSNGGLCQNLLKAFNCDCSAVDYIGIFCQQSINQCSSNPCTALAGTSCVDGIFSYSCVCPAGYTGVGCLEIIDYCSSSPCMNGGICTPSLNLYSCTCPLPFGDRDCGTNVTGICGRGYNVGSSGMNITSSSCPSKYTFIVPATAVNTSIPSLDLIDDPSLAIALPLGTLAATVQLSLKPDFTVFNVPYPTIYLPLLVTLSASEKSTLKLYSASAGRPYAEPIAASVVQGDDGLLYVVAQVRHFSIVTAVYVPDSSSAASSSSSGGVIVYAIAGAGGAVLAVILIVFFVHRRRGHKKQLERAASLRSMRGSEVFDEFSQTSMSQNRLSLPADQQRIADMKALREFARRMSGGETGELVPMKDLRPNSPTSPPDDGEMSPDMFMEDDDSVINPLTLSRKLSKLPMGVTAGSFGGSVMRRPNSLRESDNEESPDDMLDDDDDGIINPLTLSRHKSKLPVSAGSSHSSLASEQDDDDDDDNIINPLTLSRKLSKVAIKQSKKPGEKTSEEIRNMARKWNAKPKQMDIDIDKEFGFGNLDASDEEEAPPEMEEIGEEQDDDANMAMFDDVLDDMTFEQLAEIRDAVYEQRDAAFQPKSKKSILEHRRRQTILARKASMIREVPALEASAGEKDDMIYGVNLFTSEPVTATAVLTGLLAKPKKAKAALKLNTEKAKEFEQMFKALPAQVKHSGGYDDEDDEEVGALLLDKQYVRTWLTFEGEIGKGNFGYVLKASSTQGGKMPQHFCAVKTLNPEATQRDQADFVLEAQQLSEMDHPNVLSLTGVCMECPPWLIVTPFAAYGDLKGFLNRCLENADKFALKYSEFLFMNLQLSRAIAYIKEKRILHRDIAARNILLYDNCVVQLSDFGLSARLPEGQSALEMQPGGKLPLRWMAPEALLKNLYYPSSDVWSMAVAFWEIFTHASTRPYSEIPTDELLEHLINGNRIKRPNNCPENLFAVWADCWKYAEHSRPTAGEVTERLQALMEKTNDPVRNVGNVLAGFLEEDNFV